MLDILLGFIIALISIVIYIFTGASGKGASYSGGYDPQHWQLEQQKAIKQKLYKPTCNSTRETRTDPADPSKEHRLYNNGMYDALDAHIRQIFNLDPRMPIQYTIADLKAYYKKIPLAPEYEEKKAEFIRTFKDGYDNPPPGTSPADSGLESIMQEINKVDPTHANEDYISQFIQQIQENWGGVRGVRDFNMEPKPWGENLDWNAIGAMASNLVTPTDRAEYEKAIYLYSDYKTQAFTHVNQCLYKGYKFHYAPAMEDVYFFPIIEKTTVPGENNVNCFKIRIMNDIITPLTAALNVLGRGGWGYEGHSVRYFKDLIVSKMESLSDKVQRHIDDPNVQDKVSGTSKLLRFNLENTNDYNLNTFESSAFRTFRTDQTSPASVLSDEQIKNALGTFLDMYGRKYDGVWNTKIEFYQNSKGIWLPSSLTKSLENEVLFPYNLSFAIKKAEYNVNAGIREHSGFQYNIVVTDEDYINQYDAELRNDGKVINGTPTRDDVNLQDIAPDNLDPQLEKYYITRIGSGHDLVEDILKPFKKRLDNKIREIKKEFDDKLEIPVVQYGYDPVYVPGTSAQNTPSGQIAEAKFDQDKLAYNARKAAAINAAKSSAGPATVKPTSTSHIASSASALPSGPVTVDGISSTGPNFKQMIDYLVKIINNNGLVENEIDQAEIEELEKKSTKLNKKQMNFTKKKELIEEIRTKINKYTITNVINRRAAKMGLKVGDSAVQVATAILDDFGYIPDDASKAGNNKLSALSASSSSSSASGSLPQHPKNLQEVYDAFITADAGMRKYTSMIPTGTDVDYAIAGLIIRLPQTVDIPQNIDQERVITYLERKLSLIQPGRLPARNGTTRDMVNLIMAELTAAAVSAGAKITIGELPPVPDDRGNWLEGPNPTMKRIIDQLRADSSASGGAGRPPIPTAPIIELAGFYISKIPPANILDGQIDQATIEHYYLDIISRLNLRQTVVAGGYNSSLPLQSKLHIINSVLNRKALFDGYIIDYNDAPPWDDSTKSWSISHPRYAGKVGNTVLRQEDIIFAFGNIIDPFMPRNGWDNNRLIAECAMRLLVGANVPLIIDTDEVINYLQGLDAAPLPLTGNFMEDLVTLYEDRIGGMVLIRGTQSEEILSLRIAAAVRLPPSAATSASNSAATSATFSQISSAATSTSNSTLTSSNTSVTNSSLSSNLTSVASSVASSPPASPRVIPRRPLPLPPLPPPLPPVIRRGRRALMYAQILPGVIIDDYYLDDHPDILITEEEEDDEEETIEEPVYVPSMDEIRTRFVENLKVNDDTPFYNYMHLAVILRELSKADNRFAQLSKSMPDLEGKSPDTINAEIKNVGKNLHTLLNSSRPDMSIFKQLAEYIKNHKIKLSYDYTNVIRDYLDLFRS